MPTPRPQTATQLVMEYRGKPGINVAALKVGAEFIVETTVAVYEFTVINPEIGLVEVNSGDGRFLMGSVARLVQSVYDVEGKVAVPLWIGKDLRMQLTFKNGILPCAPTVSARILGDGWHYDVF